LRFANPSPPPGWIEDFHLQAVVHARHTKEGPPHGGPSEFNPARKCRLQPSRRFSCPRPIRGRYGDTSARAPCGDLGLTELAAGASGGWSDPPTRVGDAPSDGPAGGGFRGSGRVPSGNHGWGSTVAAPVLVVILPHGSRLIAARSSDAVLMPRSLHMTWWVEARRLTRGEQLNGERALFDHRKL
jgi:hypothetical protein